VKGMSKFFWVLAVMALAAASFAQVRMSVEMGGRRIGIAHFSQKVLADGGKQVEIRMNLESAGRTIEMTSFSGYDADGNPTRKNSETRAPASRNRRQVTVTFDAAGAIAVVEEDGNRSRRGVALVDKAPRANVSEFWFLRTQPKRGETLKVYSFSTEGLVWELLTITYTGPKEIPVAGKSVTGHEVVTERGGKREVAYLDDKGLPLLLLGDGVRMERIPEPALCP
jgi:hypothetical protein